MTLGNRFVINKSCIEPKATGVFFSKYQCLSPDEALPMTTHHPSPGFVPHGESMVQGSAVLLPHIYTLSCLPSLPFCPFLILLPCISSTLKRSPTEIKIFVLKTLSLKQTGWWNKCPSPLFLKAPLKWKKGIKVYKHRTSKRRGDNDSEW